MTATNQRILAAIVILILLLGTAGGLVAAGAIKPRPGPGTPSPLPPTSVPTTSALDRVPPPRAAQASAVERDVTYCTPDGVPLLMDVYRPRPATSAPAPAILYIHGGGWTSGDKSAAAPWASLLAARGYLVASINYRLAPDYKWPSQVEDSKCAVRYLRAKASTYNLDPNRIAAMGDSAGGHLASLLGLAGPTAGWDKSGGYEGVSSAVRAVVDMYGPTDFTSINVKENRALISQLLGVPYDQAADALKNASPVTYVHAGAPPFLIIQGEKDTLVLPRQSEILADRLKAVGVPVTLVMVQNAGHAFQQEGGPLQPSLPEIGQMIAQFFDKHLK